MSAPSAWEEALPPAPTAATASAAARPAAAASRAPQAKKPDAPPQPAFPDLLSFVTFLFKRKLFVRRPGGAVAWCPEWYRHAEVISRFTVLWDEFERARRNQTMSDWWLHHLDPHMSVILNPTSGPFMACKPEQHRETPALEIGTPDPRLFSGSAFREPPRPKRTIAAARASAAQQAAPPANGRGMAKSERTGVA